jgi:hypothetical protein
LFTLFVVPAMYLFLAEDHQAKKAPADGGPRLRESEQTLI